MSVELGYCKKHKRIVSDYCPLCEGVEYESSD